MALGHTADFGRIGQNVTATRRDRIADDLYEADTGRSNFAAFLLGGMVIAGGMLAFLYYDSDSLGRRGDDITTGGVMQLEAPASRPAPNVVIPAAPKPTP